MSNQIDLEVQQATWNSKNIFNGTASSKATAGNVMFKFQIGSGNSSTNDVLQFNLLKTGNVSLESGNTGFRSSQLRLDSSGGTRLSGNTLAGSLLGSSASAHLLMGRPDNAIADVSEASRYIGAVVNRLTYQESTLTVAQTNTEAARSRIEDADMAFEQLESTKLQILQQTSSAMLAQANSGPLFFLLQGVLETIPGLQVGLSLVLAYVGVKMLLLPKPFEVHVDPRVSMLVILGLLVGSWAVASLMRRAERRRERDA